MAEHLFEGYHGRLNGRLTFPQQVIQAQEHLPGQQEVHALVPKKGLHESLILLKEGLALTDALYAN